MLKEKCLDLGCGLVASSLENSCQEIIEVDRDFNTLSNNISVIEKGVTPVCADVASLPFKKNEFQIVAAKHVLEHLPRGQEQEVLSETKRVLKKEGLLQITTPHSNYEHLMGKIIPQYHSTDMHQQIFSKKRLEKTIESSGFSIQSSMNRNWLQAIKLVIVGLTYRFFPKRVNFLPQIGFDIQKDFLPKKINRTGKKIINKIFDRAPISSIMNKILPFEIYTEAIK